RGGVTAEAAPRRPIRQGWWRRGLVQTRELAGAVDDLAADHGEVRRDVGDLALGAGEIVAVWHAEVSELVDLDVPLLAFFVREPGDVLRPHPESRLAVDAVALRVDSQAAHGLARHEPRQRDPGIVGCHPRGVGAGRDVEALREHPRKGRRSRGSAGAVPLDEVLALVRHAVLYRDPAA